MFLFSSFLNRQAALLFVVAGLLFSNSLVYAADSKVFVSPAWLKKHQSTVKIIDMSEKANFQKFHIEGAIWVNYSWLIKPQDGLSVSGGVDYMADVLSQLGIKNSDHIVIYDDIGGLEASRLYWELDKLNHDKVNILDGGIVSWVLAGNKVTQQPPQRPAKTQYQVPKKTLTNALTADKTDVISAIKDPKIILMDTRTKAEYEGSSKEQRSGHIPGAILFDWSMAVDTKNGFKQQSTEQLLSSLRGKSINDLDQPILLYCNTAHRAARSYTMLKSIGFTNIKLYDGSIQEYSVDSSAPLKLGSRP